MDVSIKNVLNPLKIKTRLVVNGYKGIRQEGRRNDIKKLEKERRESVEKKRRNTLKENMKQVEKLHG
jgi:hypothetical protein